MLKQKRKHKAAAICTESPSFMYITKYMVVYYALIILILRSHNQEQKRGLQGYLKLRLQHLNLLCALIFQVTSTGTTTTTSVQQHQHRTCSKFLGCDGDNQHKQQKQQPRAASAAHSHKILIQKCCQTFAHPRSSSTVRGRGSSRDHYAGASFLRSPILFDPALNSTQLSSTRRSAISFQHASNRARARAQPTDLGSL